MPAEVLTGVPVEGLVEGLIEELVEELVKASIKQLCFIWN